MIGFFKTKGLWLGVLFAFSLVGVWKFRASPQPTVPAKEPEAGWVKPSARVPVEVLVKGSAPEWVYVEVGTQSVPEPSVVGIIGLTTVLLTLRRQRAIS